MPFRYDTSPLPHGVERTPSGGLRVPARLARTGLQEYELPDGTLRVEYRPPAEVHADEALASFRGAPVTEGHHGEITPKNWRLLSRGHVDGDVRADGEYVAGTVCIQDAKAVQAVLDKKLTEISCGYEVELDMTPGEIDGVRYDAVQRRIRGNHVALIPTGTGRAGPEVRLRLDSAGAQVPSATEAKNMPKVKVGGIEYDAIGDPLRQAVAAVEADLQKERGRADAAEARAIEAEARATEAADPKRVDALVKERVAFVERVRRVDAKIDVDGRSEEEILREVLKDRCRLDGTEPLPYLQGLLEGLQRSGGQRTDVQDVAPPAAPTQRARWTPSWSQGGE